jgi:hypothetical protein
MKRSLDLAVPHVQLADGVRLVPFDMSLDEAQKCRHSSKPNFCPLAASAPHPGLSRSVLAATWSECCCVVLLKLLNE